MAGIKRYNTTNTGLLVEAEEGEVVRYGDHIQFAADCMLTVLTLQEEKEYWRTLAMQAQRGR